MRTRGIEDITAYLEDCREASTLAMSRKIAIDLILGMKYSASAILRRNLMDSLRCESIEIEAYAPRPLRY
jgi:hypothetical protein